MGVGTTLRDDFGFGDYVRRTFLPREPEREPIEFRGFVDRAADALPFVDEVLVKLRAQSPNFCAVSGPSVLGRLVFHAGSELNSPTAF